MKLTIFRKGLILVAVPLLFQLGLIGIVALVQRQVVEAANSFDHTQEVLAQSEVVLRRLHHLQIGMRGYVLTENPTLQAPYDRGIEEVPAEFTKLKTLVRDDSEQHARVAELEAKVSRFLAWQAARIKETQDGNREKAIDEIGKLDGENQMEAIRADFAALRDAERKDAAKQKADRDQVRQQLQWVLIGGVIASLGITLVLAIVFNRGVHSGLTTLINNAERLGQRRELLPPLTGQDEISQVDGAFHKTVAELARADQAQRAADAETQRTMALLDRARDAVFMFDPDSLRFFYVNQGAIDQVGFTRAELLTMTPVDIKPEFDEPTFRRLVAPLKDGLHDQHVFTTVHRRKDGRDVPVEIILQCIPVNHHAKGFVAQVRDITERRKAEETIRLYADIVKSIPIGLLMLRLDNPDDDRSLRIVDVNPTASTLLGFDVRTMQGKMLVEAFPANTPAMLITYAGVVRTGTPTALEEIQYGDERVKSTYWSVKAFPLPDRRVGLAFENISARKHAEEAIRRLNQELEQRVGERTRELSASEQRYRRLIEHAGDGIFLFDREQYLDVNPAACDMLGYSRQELLGQSVASVVMPEEVARIAPELDRVTDGTISTQEWRVRRKDGSSLPVEVRLRQMPDGKYLAFARDITERKRAGEAIRQLSDRIESILNSAGEGILGLDAEGRTSFANPAALKMLGRTFEELQAGIQHELIHHSRPDGSPYPRAECPIYRALVDGTVHAREDEVFWKKDGSSFPVSYNSTPIFEDGKIRGAVVVFRDITERKRAEEQLRLQGTAIEGAANGIVITDPQGMIVYVNPAFTAMTGYTRAEALGNNPRILKSDKQGQDYYQHLWETILSGHVWHGEMINQRKDGSEYVELQTITPMRDGQGAITHFIGIKQDITERKQAEAALREMNVQLEQRVADRTRDLQQAKLAADRALERLRHIEWLITKTTESNHEKLASRHQPQSYGDLIQLNTSRVIAGAVEPEVLTDIVDDYLDLLDSSAAVYETNGDYALGLFSSGWCRFMDESSRRQCGTADNREALAGGKWLCHESCWKTSRQSIETDQPADLACDGGIRIYAVPIRVGGKVVGSINFGYGDPPRDPARLQELADKYGVAVEDLRSRSETYESRPPYLIQLAKERLQSSARLLGMMIERKRAEELIAAHNRQLQTLNRSFESAKNQAEQANRAKSDFLSRMSHELRTPLNSILGFGQRLTKSELAERDQHRVAQIVKAGQHLLDLINEILDLARIEAGRLTISPEPLAVDTALTDALDLIRPLARDHRIDLRLEAVPPGWYVAADKQRLRQVLLNILSNAIKYNRQGGRVTLRCSEPEPGQVRLAVEDTGAGIPAEKLPLLFRPFERLGIEGSAIEGTGLGLSLAQKLVELMSGRIRVESTVGVGTIVSVDLPRATSALARSAPKAIFPTVPLAAQRSLLYIEDNLANINLVEDILQDRPGCRLLTAMQGGLGLELVRQHHPDLILLDVHLPDMMGDEFMRRLQADPAIQQIPVVVLSADATARQIKTLKDLGARAYLTKPIDADQFLRTIDSYLLS